MRQTPKLRLALDHNFPAPVLAAFDSLLGRVELVAIRDLDPAYAELADWELFVALHRRTDIDGLVTNDDALLSLPKEMTVLSQTHLTLVVAKGEGHSPIRAVGVLLCHLNHICEHSQPERAQIWRLSVKQKDAEIPHDYLEKIAERAKSTVKDIVAAHKLPGSAFV